MAAAHSHALTPEPAGLGGAVVPLAPLSPVERELASYRQLVETAHLLLARGSLQDVLNRVADALERLISVDTLAIYTADNDRRVLHPALARGAWSDVMLETPFAF